MLRLIGLIAILAVFLGFIGINVDNRCDIRYWFGENDRFTNVPVYLTAFASFALGMLWTLPTILFVKWKKSKSRKSKSQGKGAGRKKGNAGEAAESEAAEQEKSVEQV